ncbi:hypothetical protein B0H17DRAFT_1143987 [Mycena rosella]|uniref:Uncharacterized protein n=1 Tax=Mycena rosella TaxID=1033263 RepID=A0AAD7G667_MYCRO|nr:hypothetical protein B0H17DRAFT_1143987 [Mycena rosella]
MSSKFATITRITGKLLTFHRGKVTALTCSDFQDGCNNYFSHKDTTPAKKVGVILALSNDANTTAITLDDKRIFHTLEVGMLPDLSRRYMKDPKASKIADDQLDEWLHAIVEIDEVHQYEDECMAFFVFNANTDKGKRKVLTDASDDHNAKKLFTKVNANTKPTSSSTASSSSSSFCPPLTADERALLSANDGCNKCHIFFVGHRSDSPQRLLKRHRLHSPHSGGCELGEESDQGQEHGHHHASHEGRRQQRQQQFH